MQRSLPPPPTPPAAAPAASPSAIQARLEEIIRTGGPIPSDKTRVIGAAIIEVEGEGYKGPKEMRAISGAGTDPLGKGAPVYHASTPDERALSATRSIAGAGRRKEFPFSHINDAEIKLGEDIVQRLPKDAKATVHMLTMRARKVGDKVVLEPYPACSGCVRGLFEIAGELPKVDIVSYAPTHPTATLEFGGAGPESTEVNPLPKEPPKTSLEKELPKSGLTGEGPGPMLPELGELETTPKAGIRGAGGMGRAGRLGVAALEAGANIVLEIAMLAATIIIEFVIIPKLNAMIRKLEEDRKKQIQEKVKKKFEDYESKHIGRILKSCYLKELRKMEKAGKKAYVNVDLLVDFEDTSGRLQLFTETPPESFFDIELDDVRLANATLSDTPVETSVGPLKRCESCGTFGRGKTFVTNNPIWEQKLTFSFEAPASSAIEKEFKEEPETPEQCVAEIACFIATACYGSLLAPEVDTLRRFRNYKLLTNRPGRMLVRAYYAVSPPVALWLMQHGRARSMVRRGLVGPLIRWVRFWGWDRLPGHPRDLVNEVTR